MDRTTSHRRAYELWTDERNVELVELLRSELTLAEIAERTGRSATALQGQIRKLIPPDYRIRKSDAELVARGLLRSPDYGWREVLRDRAAHANQVYWDGGMDDILRRGWEQMRPLQELTETVGASELEVARQLMRLGLAESCRETAERLGCDPAGTLAGRLRLAEDRAAAAVWVLVVDGARGAERVPIGVAEHRRHNRHVSVHLDYDTADLALDDILREHVGGGGDPDEVTASIVERTVGDLSIGAVADPARGTTSSQTVTPESAPGLGALVDLDEPSAPTPLQLVPRIAEPESTNAIAADPPPSPQSRFDDAVDSARRVREFGEYLEQSRQKEQQEQQRRELEFAEQTRQLLTEAAEKMREHEGLELLLIRPKKRFERADHLFVPERDAPRYVVVDRQRCWILPPAPDVIGAATMLLTERAELVWLDNRIRVVSSEQPRTIAMTEQPRAVDIRKAFLQPHLPGDPSVPELYALQSALARCYVEHEHTLLLPPAPGGLSNPRSTRPPR